MKKRLLWILAIGVVAGLPGASGATITLSGPAGPVSVGSSFWMDVNVATGQGENIWAYQLDIQFDPAVLQFQDARDGTFLPPADLALGAPAFVYNPGDGAVTGIGNSLSFDAPGVSGTGLLVQVKFLAMAESPGTFLSPLNTLLLDFDLTQLGGVAETGAGVAVTGGGVPEPGTYMLVALGLAAAALARRRTSLVRLPKMPYVIARSKCRCHGK